MSNASRHTRETVYVPSAEPGVDLEVWLYLPVGHGDGPFPVVVAGHGLSLVKSAGLQAFAEKWAEIGWASLVLDYRGFGGSGGARNFCSVHRQTEDYRSVLQWAKNGEKRALFIADKVVVFGSAMSGLNVSHFAVNANEEGVAGAMAHCPMLDGYAGCMALPADMKLMFWVLLDWARGKLGLSPTYVNAVAKHGASALCSTPSCYDGFTMMYEQSDKPFSEMPNIVPGRLMLEIMGSRPDLSKVQCPFLVVVPEEDDLVIPHVSREAIAKAKGKIRSVSVPGGHFDIMKGGVGHEPNVKAQLDFLQSLA